MKFTLLKYFLLIICLYALFLGAWPVINGDLHFHTDIARDFLLMQEITDKKIVLIGPRADWKGLFHGPLWLYVNYPAFILSHGNPIAVGWFWIGLTIACAVAYYFIAKSLFNNVVGIIFSSLFILAMVPYMNSYYNPSGAILTTPFYFFFAVKYWETKKIKYLLLHLFYAGIVTQFQLAVGIPFMILSLLWLAYETYKTKNPRLLLTPLILLLPLSTFLIFNLRHHFSYITAIFEHFSSAVTHENYSFFEKLTNRVSVMTSSGLGFFRDGQVVSVQSLIGYFIAIMTYAVISNTKNKKRHIYILFLYFYIGFYVLSFIHSGFVLPHYFLPLTTLPLLIFSSLALYADKRVFGIFLTIIIVTSLYFSTQEAIHSEAFRGKDKDSWKFQYTVFSDIYKRAKDKELGVFIYTPDIYAYSPKYAFAYTRSLHPEKKVFYQEKKHETFLIYEPPPPERMDLDGTFWRETQVKITSQPIAKTRFPDGYRLEQYHLTKEEISEPSDSTINDWVSQR